MKGIFTLGFAVLLCQIAGAQALKSFNILSGNPNATGNEIRFLNGTTGCLGSTIATTNGVPAGNNNLPNGAAFDPTEGKLYYSKAGTTAGTSVFNVYNNTGATATNTNISTISGLYIIFGISNRSIFIGCYHNNLPHCSGCLFTWHSNRIRTTTRTEGSIMSKLKVKNITLGDNVDTTKNISINVPTVADGTLTIETEAGTDILKVNADGGVQHTKSPTFFVSRITSSQTIADATPTLVQFNSETFDVGSCFDSTTNYNYTPNVAGYYLFTWGINMSSSVAASIVQAFGAIHKNTTEIARGSNITGVSATTYLSTGSAIMQMNGIGDYVDIRAFCDVSSGTISVLTGSNLTYFSGTLVRAL